MNRARSVVEYIAPDSTTVTITGTSVLDLRIMLAEERRSCNQILSAIRTVTRLMDQGLSRIVISQRKKDRGKSKYRYVLVLDVFVNSVKE